MKADVLLPQALADEVLWQYADVLRVGRLTLNGRELTWNNSTSNDAQLSGFCETFIGALKEVPALAGVEGSDLCQATHWFCKAVSINYALSELLCLLQKRLGERLGAVCSVATSGPSGNVLVEYAVTVTERRSMLVRVNWRGQGNIICCNPKTAKKTVKGTLSYVETEFPIPLDPSFRPTYRIQMKLQSSRPTEFINKVSRSISGLGVRRTDAVQEVSPLAPLRSVSCLDLGAAASVGSASTASSGHSGGGTPDLDDSDLDLEDGVEDILFLHPLSFEARTVRTQSGALLPPQKPGGAPAERPLRAGLIRL